MHLCPIRIQPAFVAKADFEVVCCRPRCNLENLNTHRSNRGRFALGKGTAKFYGRAVLCIEGKSEIERIQVASRGRPLVRSPGPRLCA